MVHFEITTLTKIGLTPEPLSNVSFSYYSTLQPTNTLLLFIFSRVSSSHLLRINPFLHSSSPPSLTSPPHKQVSSMIVWMIMMICLGNQAPFTTKST